MNIHGSDTEVTGNGAQGRRGRSGGLRIPPAAEGNPGQAGPSDRITVMKGLLKEIGVSEGALILLKRLEDLTTLCQLCTAGHRTSAFIVKMVNAVAETTPTKLTRLLGVMSTYRGSKPILEAFLTLVGHQNPFLAAERAQIQILPAAADGSTRGVSGHILTRMTYIAFDPTAPNSTVGYTSGKQAITSIFEAFYPERFSESSRARVTNRRRAAILKEFSAVRFEDVTLKDLETDPAIARGFRSQLIARNLEVYQELRRAIAEYTSAFASQVYGGNVLLPAINSLRVANDPGRQLWGWFEEHLAENPNAPLGIVIAFTSLRDPDIELSEEEERHYIRGLLAYQRLNSFINKGVALHGLVSDLQVYDALLVEDPLRLDPAIEMARAQVKHKLAQPDTELTMTAFSELLEVAAMVTFRSAMNARVLDIYGEELTQALAHFDFVSFENGTWREDARGDTVPMDRLKRHIYGAKIGVAKVTDSVDRKRALLSQADFKHIMDAQFLTRLISEPAKLLNAKPVSEFKEMVEGVIVAYRKALFFDAELRKFKESVTGAAVTWNPDDIGESLAAWKPVLPFGGKYKPSESWGLETTGPKPIITDLREVVRRFKDGKSEVLASAQAGSMSKLNQDYEKWSVEVNTYAEIGLYLPEMDHLWRRIATEVQQFTPAAQLEELINTAVQLAADPMVVLPLGYLLPEQDILLMLNKRFLSARDIKTLQDFISAKDQIASVSHGFGRADLVEIRKQINTLNLHNAIIYKGFEGRYPSGKGKLSLESRPFRAIAGATTHPKLSWISYYDPRVAGEGVNKRTLKQKLDSIERSTVTTASLGSEWCVRARKLCSQAGKAALDSHNFLAVENATYRTAQGLVPCAARRVTNTFVELVNRLMPPK